MSKQKKVAVLGATGYGGSDLVRHLLLHPLVDLRYATSRSKAGVPLGAVHRNLDGFTAMTFSSPSEEELMNECDIIIGALPHKNAAVALAPFIDAEKTVIDLSGDFRLKNLDDYTTWYKADHPRPDLLGPAVYGCPELYSEKIKSAKLVASPGCFATAMNLALLPLAKAGMITGAPQVTAMTGSSGSGAEAKPGTHHPVRSQTLRPYKVLDHQHVPECLQLAREAGSKISRIAFVPVSAPITRGILCVASVEVGTKITGRELDGLYNEFYDPAPYIKVLKDRDPECASVAGTNYAEVRARVDQEGRVLVITAIDNLLKGGAGQALESLDIILYNDWMARAPLNWPGMWP